MAKTSEQYWIDRAEQKIKGVDRAEEKYLGRLKGSYQRANRDIKKSVNAFYAEFAKKEGLTYAQATQVVGKAEQRILQQSAAEIADKLSRGDAAIKKDLEAFAKKRQINRLQGLDSETRGRIAQLGNIQNSGMDDVLATTLQSVYEQDLFTIQKGQGFGTQYGRISDTKVNAVLKHPWNGENYSSRLWGNKEALANIVQQELTEGIIAGRSNAEITQAIQQKMGSEFNAASRLVRTEMTNIAAEADVLAYEDSGIARYEYLATLDNRTSEVCEVLDGQTFKVQDAQAGVNLPPMHPNCRSTTIADFGADLEKGLDRRAKNAEGETIKVPADMKFSEWKAEFKKP